MTMGEYSKILVAFDGSVSSRNALKQAIEKFENSWIKVLAVVPVYEGDLELVGVHNLKKVLDTPTDDLLEAAREIAGSESARIMTNVEQGEVYEKIVDVADKEECTLIVMGRRGLHRLERMLIGSVTARVLVRSTHDVLVVPRYADIKWDNILLATDGSDFSEAALDRAIRIAKEYGAGFKAVSVTDMHPEFYADAAIVGSMLGSKKDKVVENMEKRSMEILDAVRERAAAEGVEVETQLLRGDPAEEIAAYAGGIQAGIIFLGSRGRSGLKKVFLGSVAEKVIGLADCAVYVAKTRE